MHVQIHQNEWCSIVRGDGDACDDTRLQKLYASLFVVSDVEGMQNFGSWAVQREIRCLS